MAPAATISSRTHHVLTASPALRPHISTIDVTAAIFARFGIPSPAR